MRGTLIIGYGNPLRGDDAVGYLAAERIVGALAVHQLTPELMEPISRADRVIFVDAVADGVPGTIRRRRLGLDSAGGSMTHHTRPMELLAGARFLFGHAPEAWLFTISGAKFGQGDELSESVSRALDRLVGELADEVQQPAAQK